jgi:hypothetical protein
VRAPDSETWVAFHRLEREALGGRRGPNYLTVKALIDADLLERRAEETSKFGTIRAEYFLSDKGRRIADLLSPAHLRPPDPPPPPELNHSELIDAAAARHDPERGWFFVRDTSLAYSRRIYDGIAIPMWRSAGSGPIGYEAKTSRADWLGEIKDPTKREDLSAICQQFIFITCKGVAKKEEVPVDCGLLEVIVDKNGNFASSWIKRAPKKEPRPPKDWIELGYILRHLLK